MCIRDRVEPIDAILSQPTWTGASANADETNALIEKLWTPIEEDGYGTVSYTHLDVYKRQL